MNPVAARRRRIGRRIALGLLAALVLAGAAGGWQVRRRLQESLPILDGEVRVAGLLAPVAIARDTLGVPSIGAADRADAALALGFLHAQDRFFQMDCLRRRAAGELAELFGPAVLQVDRGARVHRFRPRALETLQGYSNEDRAVVDAYTAGVNRGLSALVSPPFEYLLLRIPVVPWRPEDVVLAGLAMYLELQDDQPITESARGLLRDALPDSLATFLSPGGSEWDAPNVGEPFEAPPVPGPEVFDARQQTLLDGGEVDVGSATSPLDADDRMIGSNNWAMAGGLTADGRAWLAGDMHLGLSVPNTWYRASVSYPDSGASGGMRTVTGVTLPGTPAILAGSNGDVAWAFTNSYVDAADIVLVEMEGEETYRTPEGPRAFERRREPIVVHGAADDTLEVVETIWGPVIGRDHKLRPRVLRWVAHDPGAVDLGLLRLERARGLDEALDFANRCAIPAQNCVVADRAGRIGWTILGLLPRRAGFDGRVPTSWADGARRWDGMLPPAEVPRIADPASGRVWTANQRVVDGALLARLGDGGYALGARARQIRDALFAMQAAKPEDFLRLQLDDRALFLERWRGLLLDVLSPENTASDRRRAEARRLVENWGGHAGIESAGYRIVRTYRGVVSDLVLATPTLSCSKADPRFHSWMLGQREGPVWKLVRERPPHFLDPRFASWDAALLAAADSTLERIQRGSSDLASRTWGERNTTRIQHPLGRGVRGLGRWLDMDARPLPGDAHMPRVQSPSSGASQRMVVSPGQEEKGFFHMPCGQSGHPLSPHYRDGHRAWEEGSPTPFLPGPAKHTLRLVPRS